MIANSSGQDFILLLCTDTECIFEKEIMALSELGIAHRIEFDYYQVPLVAWLGRIMPLEDHQLWSRDGMCFTTTAMSYCVYFYKPVRFSHGFVGVA